MCFCVLMSAAYYSSGVNRRSDTGKDFMCVVQGQRERHQMLRNHALLFLFGQRCVELFGLFGALFEFEFE